MSRPNAHAFRLPRRPAPPIDRHGARYGMFALTMAATMVGLSHAPLAMADTEVVLNGKVTAGTCVVVARPVVWTDISAADIPVAKGRVASSAERFDIEMTGCAGVKFAKLTFGQVADQHPDQTDTFRNTAPIQAPHLSIWMQRANAAGNCPGNGSTQGPGSTYTMLIDGADITLPMCATYWNVDGGAVTAGEVYASVTIGIAYQ